MEKLSEAQLSQVISLVDRECGAETQREPERINREYIRELRVISDILSDSYE